MKKLLLVIFYLLLFNICSIIADKSFDFHLISYNELLTSAQVYQNDDDHMFDAITIDQQHDQIIVGAKNVIIRLSLGDFQLLERFKWESSTNEKAICHNQIQTFNECENYIRVIALRSHDQSLLTCGTNAYHPICVWRRPDSLSTFVSNEKFISGSGKSPYNSQYSSVYNLIDTGELYSATINEPIFGVNDPLIQRSFSLKKQLRTQQHDSNWLKNPYFVRILNIGQYMYTFFRETSLEHLSCGMNVYSRLARVCKYDDGAMQFSDTFRSYSKLRILCSKKLLNEINSFDFNELQSIYFHSSLNLIYGAFNVPKSGLIGSAICIYTVEQLESVFKSSFLTQKSNDSYWMPSSTEQDMEKCDSSLSNELLPVSSGPVLRSKVLQSSFNALILDDIRIGHLLVDHFNDLTILFVITLDGLWLRKYSLIVHENDKQLCLIEQIELKPSMISSDEWKVNKAEFISQKKEIILTTSKSVLKISVARCNRFNTSHLCSAAMDPYCTWDNYYQRCTFSKLLSWKNFRQLLTCPILNITMDGSWTSWSSWSTCQQETGETCQCRTRTCTQPKPQFGGKLCQGNFIEINRCEIHGGWSPWSTWSICSQKCGKRFRSRTRTCTNPKPKNNGRICIGPERDEEPCPEIICSNETSRLSSWTEWDVCSKSCGSGMQKRRRSCLSNHEKCTECLNEMRLCNELPCSVEPVAIWSNWTRTTLKDQLNGNDIITETRTRFVCTIFSSSDQQLLKINSDKVLHRVCGQEGDNCQQTDPPDDWSSWSDWSECFPSCDITGSTQTRRRTCLGRDCFGEDIEIRDCLSCSSQLKNNWSCWTDWSDCSLCSSIRSYSTKYRTRTCLTNSCNGLSREERSCLCPSLLELFNEYRFNFLQLILISSISFLFGCLLIFCMHRSCCYHCRRRVDDKNNFPRSTSNSSSSPHTAIDSDTFTTLLNTNTNQNKFRSFDSSSLSKTCANNYFKDIPSKKLNMYINSKDISSLPPLATLKRESLMSSMKINLDADDI
ncbi:unnamed protein product [Rotaria magnacalcarata]|uniref:Sema domain-containing protein n=1 Tax=Rotaria magnacalcarata TaxID=392030 RepID=A0A819U2W0_9BILA|nr:unnamed protein product [Rotaria magnacalcarata]CAF4073467.1 unnamed protein product [Rotaria magnacalcarata]